MKQLFSIAFGLLSISALNAQTTPAVYPDAPFQNFSPDGKWAVNDAGDNNPMTIRNFDTDTEYSYYEQYCGGSGNFISNTGVIVGRDIATEAAYYWQNGKWNKLPVASNILMSFANGITPDGSRIVGTLSPEYYAGDSEGTMTVPCYWDLKADGSYTDPIMLPHPTRDFSDRDPQYITAVRVSADGKTIAGQMRDFFGLVSQPVIYTQDQNGEWSFTQPLDYLFHPADLTLSPYPGDGPTQQQFMTPAEIAAYNNAVRAWEMGSNSDYSDYPDIYDYMTEEEFMEFAQAFTTWEDAYYKFENDFWQLLEKIPNFTYNNIFMTSDGKYIASTDAKYFKDEAQDIDYKVFVPYLINVEKDTYQKFPAVNDINIMVSSLCDDGTILGQWSDDMYGIHNGYILPAGESEFIELYEFVKGINPATAQWMEENMTHDFIAIDPVTNKEYQATALATGIPFATPDMSLIGFAQFDFWNMYDYTYTGYLISLPAYAGIESTEISNNVAIKSLGNGELLVEGDVKSIDIFSLSGMKVFSRTSPGNKVNTSLHKGIYLVRIQEAAGGFFTKKLVIN